MTSFGWLHLSDLHQGMDGQGWLWPNVREQLHEDLGKLHRVSGPWDAVLFTGDLTQSGKAEEFDALTRTLSQLWDHLRKLGSNPVLLTVPGNHDLVRPAPKKAVVKALSHWHSDADLRRDFWRDDGSEYRALVEGAFASYSAWSEAHPIPRPAAQRAGMLPGDFAATLEKDGARLGVLGLNSAFLQLTGGDHRGKLDLGAAQLARACGDGVDWVNGHHACLLLTHHPADWLSEAGRQVLRGEIAPPGRFAIHLFGHMHEGRTQTLSVGGAAPWRDWQGWSLFGLEHWGEAREERRHGYSAGRLEMEGERARLRIWPRVGKRRKEGFWRITPDMDDFDLEDDFGTRPEEIQLRRLLNPAARRSGGASTAIPFSPSTPPAPGAPSPATAGAAPEKNTISSSLAASSPQAPGSSQAAAPPPRTVNVILLYSRPEEELASALRAHLAGMRKERSIALWDESQIRSGAVIADEWARAVASAEIALVLISAGYLADERRELQSIFAPRPADRPLAVLPILARPCAWEYGPFRGTRPLPASGKAISTWTHRDEAFVEIETELRRLVASLSARPARTP